MLNLQILLNWLPMNGIRVDNVSFLSMHMFVLKVLFHRFDEQMLMNLYTFLSTIQRNWRNFLNTWWRYAFAVYI